MAEYIEREAVREALYQAFKMPSNSALWKTTNYVINKIPTADVRPVVRGEWERVGTIENTWIVSKCSVCGNQTIDAGGFCTNCGADMRGDAFDTQN